MTLTTRTTALVLAKNIQPSQDGRTNYYNLAIFADGAAGNMSCTEEVYDLVATGVENELIFAYNDTYKSMRITGARPVHAQPAPAPDAKPDGKQAAK